MVYFFKPGAGRGDGFKGQMSIGDVSGQPPSVGY